MRFAITIPNFSPWTIPLITDMAKKAETLGYDGCFLNEHLMLPFQNESYDPWILLSYLAHETTTIKLGTNVTLLPFRQPTLLAKMATTLDILSNGRLIVGVSVGWFETEFEAYGHCGMHEGWNNVGSRVRRMKESLEVMNKLWAGDRVAYKGKYYTVENAVLQPKPIQKPHPPVWVGGTKSYVLKLTASLADGWISRPRSQTVPLGALREQMEMLKQLHRRSGRDGQLTYSHYGGFIVPEGVESIEPLPYAFYPMNKAVDSIEEIKQMGFDWYITWFYPVDKSLELMKRFADEVVSTIK
ncbi:MAG: LLM class flavin-dependent oxidoreductase [Candidatus Bathyarchaeia archaeon]